MTHVLETGLEFLESNNPGDLPKVRGYNIINGQLTSSSDGSTFVSINPAILVDELGEFPLSTRDDVHSAIAAARAALDGWAATPAPTRGQIIGNMGRLLMEHKDAIVALETREIGKTLKEAAGSVQEAIDTCLFFQSEGRRLYGQTVNSELPDKELFTYRRPLGVCGIINACNFPAAVPFWKMIPALICGNTCVWKSPQDAPLLSFALARIMHQAGLPNGVVNLVHGKGSGAGQYIVDAVDEGLINKISFTGSTEVGKAIGEVCGRNLVSCSLELGGKNPLVVMPSADIDNAVEGAYWGGFGTAGQRCTSLGNLIIHESIYDEFMANKTTCFRVDTHEQRTEHQWIGTGEASTEMPKEENRYKILELLGEGGMGCVYRVQDNVLRRIVAMKKIHPELITHIKDRVQRIHIEIRSAEHCVFSESTGEIVKWARLVHMDPCPSSGNNMHRSRAHCETDQPFTHCLLPRSGRTAGAYRGGPSRSA